MELEVNTNDNNDANVYDSELVATIDSVHVNKIPFKIYIIEVKVTPPNIDNESY